MAIYKEYLTGEDRDIFIEEATLENELDKLDTMYEMTLLQLGQMYKDAEFKVLTESGTYEDLMYLYQEADAEVQTQQKNIFQKILDAIISIFNSIGKAIKGLFSGGNPEEEVEVPKESVESANKAVGMFGNIKQGIERVKSGDLAGSFQILKAIAIPTLAVGAAVGGTVAVVKMKKGQLQGLAKKLQEIKDWITNGIAAIKQKIPFLQSKDKGGNTSNNDNNDTNNNNDNKDGEKKEGLLKPIFDKLRAFAGWIKNIVNSLVSKIGPAGKGVKDKIDKTIEKGKQVVDDVKQVKDQAENVVSDAKDAVTGNEYEEVKKFGKVYKINKNNGKIRIFNKKGKEISSRQSGSIPKEIQDIANKIKSSLQDDGNQTNESTLINDLREILGDSYLVESAGDSFDITELEDVKLESKYIFGYDITNEEVFQESDAFDDELRELTELFETI